MVFNSLSIGLLGSSDYLEGVYKGGGKAGNRRLNQGRKLTPLFIQSFFQSFRLSNVFNRMNPLQPLLKSIEYQDG